MRARPAPAFGCLAACVLALACSSAPAPEPLRDLILAINAHVVVTKSTADFGEYRDVVAVARAIDPEVVAAAPFILIEVLIRSDRDPAMVPAVLKGLAAAHGPRRSAPERYLVAGRMADDPAVAGEPPGLVLGRELARRLGVKVGDRVTVVLPIDGMAPPAAPTARAARVTGILFTDFDEYDRRLTFMSLAAAQDLVGKGDQVLGVELWVRHIGQAARVARSLATALGQPYKVIDWCELNRAILRC